MSFAALIAEHRAVLAPMEDVTHAAFRRACRTAGATVCVTEFVGAEQIVADSELARRKAQLAPDDRPTAVQIYGADPRLLRAAAELAAGSGASWIDLNCGCWVPKIARRGAGAGWLRDPAAMVAMAGEIARAVRLPVTVKTRIGWGDEPEAAMPIVELARRLEQAGVAGLTIHCRTALMRHAGAADWRWAQRAQAAVAIPVIVNGDITTADAAVRALADTGCAGVMIGRAAIDHPWIFREVRARLAGAPIAPPTTAERIALYRELALANVAARGERHGLGVTRRSIGILGPLRDAMRTRLNVAASLAETLDVLATATAGSSYATSSSSCRCP